MSSIAGVTSGTGNIGGQGGPAEAKSLVEATLTEDVQQANWYQAPLRIPDTRNMFPLGANVNMLV